MFRCEAKVNSQILLEKRQRLESTRKNVSLGKKVRLCADGMVVRLYGIVDAGCAEMFVLLSDGSIEMHPESGGLEVYHTPER